MQGTFDLFDDQDNRPKKRERLFFCLMPDEETRSRVARIGDRLFSEQRLRGTRLKMERLHVSLQHVGDYKRLRTRLLYAAQLAGQAVSARPFDIRFRFVQSFQPAPHKPDRQPLVLLGEGGDALANLFRTLGVAMTKVGLEAAAEFNPHMTLSYGPQPVPIQAIEPVSFVVKDFALIHSRPGLTQYEVIDRWPLVN